MSTKLGEICNFQSGGTPSKNNSEFFDGTIPWVTTTSLNGSKIDERNAVTWITEKAIKESAAKIVPANSIMVGTRVGVGKVAINTVEMSTSQDIISLLDIDEERWDKDYLCKFLQSKSAYLNSQARGATIKGIKINVLADLEVPDISLKEQCYISKVLNIVAELMNARQQQLAKLDELVKARFVEMFGDPHINSKGFPTKKGLELFKISNGKAIASSRRFDNGIPAYGGNGISYHTDDVLCEKDTIVIGRVGFQSGNVHLAKGPVWVTDNAMYISEIYDNDLNLTFLCEMMEHIDFTKYQDAGDLKKVTQQPFMEMGYIIPSRKLQNEYISFIEQTNKLKLSIQNGLNQTETLKKTLMQQYFG